MHLPDGPHFHQHTAPKGSTSERRYINVQIHTYWIQTKVLITLPRLNGQSQSFEGMQLCLSLQTLASFCVPSQHTIQSQIDLEVSTLDLLFLLSPKLYPLRYVHRSGLFLLNQHMLETIDLCSA